MVILECCFRSCERKVLVLQPSFDSWERNTRWIVKAIQAAVYSKLAFKGASPSKSKNVLEGFISNRNINLILNRNQW